LPFLSPWVPFSAQSSPPSATMPGDSFRAETPLFPHLYLVFLFLRSRFPPFGARKFFFFVPHDSLPCRVVEFLRGPFLLALPFVLKNFCRISFFCKSRFNVFFFLVLVKKVSPFFFFGFQVPPLFLSFWFSKRYRSPGPSLFFVRAFIFRRTPPTRAPTGSFFFLTLGRANSFFSFHMPIRFFLFPHLSLFPGSLRSAPPPAGRVLLFLPETMFLLFVVFSSFLLSEQSFSPFLLFANFF